jgi:hypothetical protein
MQQRALSRSRRSGDGRELAAIDAQVDAVQNLLRELSLAIRTFEPTSDFDCARTRPFTTAVSISGRRRTRLAGTLRPRSDNAVSATRMTTTAATAHRTERRSSH